MTTLNIQSYFEEILCRKPNKNSIEHYSKLYNKNINVRDILLKSNEYINNIKFKPLIIFIRFKKYSGDSTSIIADRYIFMLRKFYNVSDFEYNEDNNIDRLREITFNHNKQKILIIHTNQFINHIPIANWWNSQDNNVFNNKIIGFANIVFDYIPNYNTFNHFKILIVPNNYTYNLLVNNHYFLSKIQYPLKTYIPIEPKTKTLITLYIIENQIDKCIQLSNWIIKYIGNNDSLQLKIKTSNLDKSQLINSDKITIINGIVNNDTIDNLHNDSDILVSIYPKSSNLNIYEAILKGNIVITPSYNYELPDDYPYQLINNGSFIQVYNSNSFPPNCWTTLPNAECLYDLLNMSIYHIRNGLHTNIIKSVQSFIIEKSNIKTIENQLTEIINNLY